MDTEQALSDLVARVRRLEDEREIRTTMQRYCHFVDHGDESGYVELFEPDARLEIHNTQTGEEARPVVGGERLARAIARHTRSPHQWHQHHVANSMIEIDGDRSTALSYFFLLLTKQTPEVVAFGRYRDEMARGADGRWRFKVRAIHLDSSGEFSVNRPPESPGWP